MKMTTTLNFVWISKEIVKIDGLPIPNTEKAPYINNINKWAELNPECKINIWIQQKTFNDDGFFVS